MFLRASFLVVVTLFMVAGSAAAQRHSVADSAVVKESRAHFQRGVELYQEGSFDAALAEFQRAHELAPNYKLLYNLAQVQAERHEYVSAIQLMTEYLHTGADDIAAERRQVVEDDIKKLRQRISALTVEVNVDGAEVFVNDTSAGRTPLQEPVLVNVGNCRVRVEKAGYMTKTHNIIVAGGDQPRVALELTRIPVATRAPSRAVTITKRDLTPFWISLGATVALGGTAAVLGALTAGANDDLDSALNQYPADPGQVDSARGKLRTMAALTDGFGAAGIVAAGFAVYFLVSPPEHTEVAPTSGVHARLGATPTGMAVTGTF